MCHMFIHRGRFGGRGTGCTCTAPSLFSLSILMHCVQCALAEISNWARDYTGFRPPNEQARYSTRWRSIRLWLCNVHYSIRKCWLPLGPIEISMRILWWQDTHACLFLQAACSSSWALRYFLAAYCFVLTLPTGTVRRVCAEITEENMTVWCSIRLALLPQQFISLHPIFSLSVNLQSPDSQTT